MRNELNTGPIYNLPINLEVLVQREKKNRKLCQTGPYCLASVKEEHYVVNLLLGPTTFRSTVVKLYYRDPNTSKDDNDNTAANDHKLDNEILDNTAEDDEELDFEVVTSILESMRRLVVKIA